MCDELKQANKIIKKLHDSNQEQLQKVNIFNRDKLRVYEIRMLFFKW